MERNAMVQAVTGAFSYSGRVIAERLLARGCEVRTLTSATGRSETGELAKIKVFPYDFAHPGQMVEALRGVSVLHNTYWVRLDPHKRGFCDVVDNTLALFAAAREAGVEHIVHISIINPDPGSPLPYFRAKARIEEALRGLGVPFTILRPAILFGRNDVLINNIAWTLRHLPVFGLFGNGACSLRPIHVDDLADLAVEAAFQRPCEVRPAVGPEIFTYRALVMAIARAIGVRRLILPLPPSLAYLAIAATGKLLGDVILSRDEMQGFLSGAMTWEGDATGQRKLSEWLVAEANNLGRTYRRSLR